MESLEDMRRQAAIDTAMRARPDATPITPAPVTARTITGHAIATCATEVLVEWVKYGGHHVRWMGKGQVTRVES